MDDVRCGFEGNLLILGEIDFCFFAGLLLLPSRLVTFAKSGSQGNPANQDFEGCDKPKGEVIERVNWP